MKKHKKIDGFVEPLGRSHKYIFDEMKVGEVAHVPVKRGMRDSVFHSCRTRCYQVSKNGKKFKAYADDHSVYYKREA